MSKDVAPTGEACEEVERLLLEGVSDPAARGRAERHLGRCARCQAVKARLEQVRADVAVAAPPLDDIRRARLLARLAPALDEAAARAAPVTPRVPGRRWRGLAAGLGLAGLAAAASAFAVVTFLDRATPDRGVAATVLEPYRVVGDAAARGLVGGHFDVLEVPAGARVRARLWERARVTLIGPARLEVASASADALEVNLPRGTLVADYDRRRGGRLRVRSPAAVTEVVGTLFAVEVVDGRSRVSVAHGRVSVEVPGTATRVLEAGSSLAAGVAEPLSAETRALLDEHEAEAGDGGVNAAAPAGAAAVTVGAPPDSAVAEAVGASGRPAPATLPPARAAETARARPLALAPSGGHHGPPSPVAVRTREPSPPAARAVAARPVAAAPDVPSSALPAAPAPETAGAAPSGALAEVASPLKPAHPISVTPARAPDAAPAPGPAAAPATIDSAASYRAAEEAMRRKDWSAARTTLARIVAEDGRSPLADLARYELAQLALRAGDRQEAARRLEQLLENDRAPALREPARFLRCELAAAGGDAAGARRCVEGFRASFPASARDEEALSLLIRLSPPAEDCAGGRPWLEEYRRRYPSGPNAPEIVRRSARCAP